MPIDSAVYEMKWFSFSLFAYNFYNSCVLVFVFSFFCCFRIINWMVAIKNGKGGKFTARSFVIKLSVYCNSNSGWCCWKKFAHSSTMKIASNSVRLSFILYIIFLSASEHLTRLNTNHRFVSHSTLHANSFQEIYLLWLLL